MIENAFVKSYQLLCTDQQEVVDEFLRKVEGILNDDTSLKRLPKIGKEMGDLHRRKEKLLDLRLDNNIDRVVFESVVEKIDIGGYNDEGVEDSLKITNFSRF